MKTSWLKDSRFYFIAFIILLSHAAAFAETDAKGSATSNAVTIVDSESTRPKLVISNRFFLPPLNRERQTPLYSLPLDDFRLQLNSSSIAQSRPLDLAIVAAVEIHRGISEQKKELLLSTLNISQTQVDKVQPFVRLALGGEPMTRSEYDQLALEFNFTSQDWLKLRIGRGVKTLSALYATDSQIYTRTQWAQLFNDIEGEIRERTEYRLAIGESAHDVRLTDRQLQQVKELGRELRTLLWYIPEGFGISTEELKKTSDAYLNQPRGLFLAKIRLLISVADENRVDSARRSELVNFLLTQIEFFFPNVLVTTTFDLITAQEVVDFYLQQLKSGNMNDLHFRASAAFLRDLLVAQAIRSGGRGTTQAAKEFAPWLVSQLKPLTEKNELLRDMIRDVFKNMNNLADSSLTIYRPLRSVVGSDNDLELYRKFANKWADNPAQESDGYSAETLLTYLGMAGAEGVADSVNILERAFGAHLRYKQNVSADAQTSAIVVLRFFVSRQTDEVVRRDGLLKMAIQYYKSDWIGQVREVEDALITELVANFATEADIIALVRALGVQVRGESEQSAEEYFSSTPKVSRLEKVMAPSNEQLEFFKRLQPMSHQFAGSQSAFEQEFSDIVSRMVYSLLKANQYTPDAEKPKTNAYVSAYETMAGQLMASAQTYLSKAAYVKLAINVVAPWWSSSNVALAYLERVKAKKKWNLDAFSRQLLIGLKQSGIREVYNRQTKTNGLLRVIDCRVPLQKNPQENN